MSRKNDPIGIMDSGVGGISVMREVINLMPNENYIYYGDSLNAPYGTKSIEEVRKLTFDIADYLLKRNIKALVVACNTATSAAVRMLRIKYPDLPIVGIEPAIKPAVVDSKAGQIIVMATPMTICEEKFHQLMNRYKEEANIVPVPFPGLMEYVERGILSGKELNQYLTKMLKPYMDQKIESIVLGCTHYPFVIDEIIKVVGKDVKIYDGSLGTAKEIKRRMEEKGLLTDAADEDETEIEIMNSQGIHAIEFSYRLLDM